MKPPLTSDHILHVLAQAQYIASIVLRPAPCNEKLDFLERLKGAEPVLHRLSSDLRQIATVLKNEENIDAKTIKLGVQMVVDLKLTAVKFGKNFWKPVYSNPVVQPALKAIMRQKKCGLTGVGGAQKRLRDTVASRIRRLKKRERLEALAPPGQNSKAAP